MPYDIIPPTLSIRAMRSSGYRDTAHAVAELVDNSVQAGQTFKEQTVVEVICIDRTELVSERQRRRIDRIAVYDNASGMDEETLRIALQFGNGTHLQADGQTGIGKFGMGLPNASISQCKRVDVWSWQRGQCLHAYLDVEEIAAGALREVPKPKKVAFPKEWQKLIRDPIGPHGTLVVWSRLDRVTWKSSRAFLENAEFLVGRMYRYFIDSGSTLIRLAAFEEGAGSIGSTFDRDVRANDPLYLMRNTSAPAPYDKQPPFDLLTEFPVVVKYEGSEHEVLLRFSLVRPDVRRKEGGGSDIGRHAAKNQGVSVVRADRELEMNTSFVVGYDPRERWWGVEVRFEPPLDDVFGVTNNKQAATSFYLMDLDEDAKAEGISPGEYRERLEQNNDPKLVTYEICKQIQRILRDLREQIRRMGEGTRKGTDQSVVPGSAEDVATRATRKRREQLGDRGRSDEDEKRPITEREHDLTEELISEGVPEEEAKQIAVEYVRSNIKFLFQEGEFAGGAMFDIKSKAGTIIVIINRRHPANVNLFERLKDEAKDAESPELRALKLLFTAWARMEDESGEERRTQLEDVRQDWGRMARDFLKEGDG